MHSNGIFPERDTIVLCISKFSLTYLFTIQRTKSSFPNKITHCFRSDFFQCIFKERGESLDRNLARRPESAISNNFGNDDEDMYSSLRVVSTGINADYGQNSVGTSSNAEINKLLSELNSRLSREVDGMMSSVNTQIHRAISDAIDSQILPQIQTALYSGSGHLTQNRWNVPSERPEINPEENCSNKTRKNSRSEQFRDRPIDGTTNDSAYDRYQS